MNTDCNYYSQVGSLIVSIKDLLTSLLWNLAFIQFIENDLSLHFWLVLVHLENKEVLYLNVGSWVSFHRMNCFSYHLRLCVSSLILYCKCNIPKPKYLKQQQIGMFCCCFI